MIYLANLLITHHVTDFELFKVLFTWRFHVDHHPLRMSAENRDLENGEETEPLNVDAGSNNANQQPM